MTKTDTYREALKNLDDWIPFLKEESGLPGPRGNLELAHVVAQEGNKKLFNQLLAFEAEENTPEVFLVFCGVVGLGKLATTDPTLFNRLREYASDPRWRIREAVATGLQLIGDQKMDLLLENMHAWSNGNWYEKRAAAAALAEPRLLKQPACARDVLQVLDEITKSIEQAPDSKDEGFNILRQAMGYCWSVAIAALPESGKPMMEKWLDSENKDIRWIMKETLKKNRLIKTDKDWAKRCLEKLETNS